MTATDPSVRVTAVYGTRPEAVKMAPLVLALRADHRGGHRRPHRHVRGRIVQAVSELIAHRDAYDRMAQVLNPYGDGLGVDKFDYLHPRLRPAS